MNGTIYLIHFERPFKHAGHYLGWTQNLKQRYAHHVAGRGSRLMAVVSEAGIGSKIVRTWKGDRYEERRLKGRGGRARLCPVCTPSAGMGRWPKRKRARR